MRQRSTAVIVDRDAPCGGACRILVADKVAAEGVARLEQGAPLTPAEIDEGFLCFDTKDFQIGYKAFLEKVKPEFEGR